MYACMRILYKYYLCWNEQVSKSWSHTGECMHDVFDLKGRKHLYVHASNRLLNLLWRLGIVQAVKSFLLFHIVIFIPMT